MVGGEGRGSVCVAVLLGALAVSLAATPLLARDGRAARGERAAALARAVLDEVALEPTTPARTARAFAAGGFAVWLYTDRDAAGPVAWVDVLDPQGRDPLGSLLAHRSRRIGTSL